MKKFHFRFKKRLFAAMAAILISLASFSYAAGYDYTIITCDLADSATTAMTAGLERVLGQVSGRIIKHDSPEAESHIEAFGIENLPYIVFSDTIIHHPKFFELARSGMIDREKGSYIVPEKMIAPAGKVMFKRKQTPGTLDVFLTSHCTHGKTALRQIENYISRNPGRFSVKVHFITEFRDFGIDSQYGVEEIRENIRQIIIQKYYPGFYRPYLAKFRAGEAFETSFADLGIDLEKIGALQDEGVSMLREDFRLCSELGITASPTFLIENRLLLEGTDALRTYLKQKEKTGKNSVPGDEMPASSRQNHVTVFYSNGCPHCRWLIDEHIPLLESIYKNVVVFDLYDISISENRDRQLEMQREQGVVGDSIPQVFVGGVDFEGRDEIEGNLGEYLSRIRGAE